MKTKPSKAFDASRLVNSNVLTALVGLLAFSCTVPQNKQVRTDQVVRATSDSVAAAIKQGVSWTQAESTVVNKPKPPVLISRIIDSKFPISNLFGIWVLDRTAPHADFWLDQDSFYLAANDEEGNRPYLIEDDSIKIYFKTLTAKGRIVKATGDTLVLRINEGEDDVYLRWQE